MNDENSKSALKTIIVILLVVVLAIVVVNPMMRQEVSFTGMNTTQTIGFGSEVVVCDAVRGQYNPRVDGDLVLYSDYRDGNSNIYGTDLTTNSEFVVANTIYPEHLMGYYGDIVAFRYASDGGMYRPYLYSLINHTSWMVSPNSTWNGFAWGDYDYDGRYYAYTGVIGSAYRLWYYDVVSGVEHTVAPSTLQYYAYPDVWGDHMAISYGATGVAVYLYNITTDNLKIIDSNIFGSVQTVKVKCNSHFVSYCVSKGSAFPNLTANVVMYNIENGHSDIIHVENSTTLPIVYVPTEMSDDYVLYAKFQNATTTFSENCLGFAVYDIKNEVWSDVPIDHSYIGVMAEIEGDTIFYSASDSQDENDIYMMDITGIITPEPEHPTSPPSKGQQFADVITTYWWAFALLIGAIAVGLIVEWKMYDLKHLEVLSKRRNQIGLVVSIVIIVILVFLIL